MSMYCYCVLIVHGDLVYDFSHFNDYENFNVLIDWFDNIRDTELRQYSTNFLFVKKEYVIVRSKIVRNGPFFEAVLICARKRNTEFDFKCNGVFEELFRRKWKLFMRNEFTAKLMERMFHPKNMDKFESWGFGVDELIII